MKVMKLALLGTAALAAVSMSARADDLSDLKSQIESLKADVAALQSAPAVPAGYSLLTMSDAKRIVVPGLEVGDSYAQSATANTIGVIPTADVPAATTVQWSGSVRAAVTYVDTDQSGGSANDADDTNVKSRGRLDVTGKSDTAVGEVGAAMSIYADISNVNGFTDNSGEVKMDYAWGWWKMTPELTFSGGYDSSLATINYGIRKINDAYISRGRVGVKGGDFTQVRVAYESGPFGIAIGLDHTDQDGNSSSTTDGTPVGGAGQITFKNDIFSAEVAGYLRDVDTNGSTSGGDETSTQIGMGIGAKLSEMFDVSMAGSYRSNVEFKDSVTKSGSSEKSFYGDGWNVSAAVISNLSEAIVLELAGGFAHYEDDASTREVDSKTIAGGLYWSPVSQLRTGVQSSYEMTDNNNGVKDEDELKTAFVTWWNF